MNAILASTTSGNLVGAIAFPAVIALIIVVSSLVRRYRDASYLRDHPEIIFRETGAYVHNELSYASSRGACVTLDSHALSISASLDWVGLSTSVPVFRIESVSLKDRVLRQPRVELSFTDRHDEQMRYTLSLRNPQGFKSAVDRLRSA